MSNCIFQIFKPDLENKTIHRDSTLTDAILHMQKTGARSLLVQDHDGRGIGILSEHDIVQAFAKNGDSVKNQPVANYMTLDLVVAEETADIDYVIRLMSEYNVRHMPVISSQGKVVSFLTVLQILMAKIVQPKA